MTGRALVLGGGGVTGIAWEIGVLAGLAEAGVDLSDADLVVGTSAGSVVGTLVACGTDLETMYEAQLAAPDGEVAARISSATLLRYGWSAISSRDPIRYRTRIGQLARATTTVTEEERRAVFEARLAGHDWPERRLLVTAVDAESGEFVAFDRDSGVRLIDAVGASCAVPGVWPPVNLNGRRWMDGGIRSAANADLAAGYERVVVLAPIVVGVGPVGNVGAQVRELERRGARALVVAPDRVARQAIGRNLLDPVRRAPSARAGRAQAASVLAAAAAVWTD